MESSYLAVRAVISPTEMPLGVGGASLPGGLTMTQDLFLTALATKVPYPGHHTGLLAGCGDVFGWSRLTASSELENTIDTWTEATAVPTLASRGLGVLLSTSGVVTRPLQCAVRLLSVLSPVDGLSQSLGQ